jgi:hypothetical protein
LAGGTRATIVMTVRDRFAHTVETAERILATVAEPVRFVFAAHGVPERVRRGLAPHVASGALEIVDPGPAGRLPTHARIAVADAVETPWTVFLDNEVVPEPDWLPRLIACAEETGAGIVGPAYLWRGREGRDRVHMAGGTIAWSDGPGGRRIAETHCMSDRLPSELPEAPERCDFVEFHCMLVRTALLRRCDLLRADVATVHEHLHASLAAREAGAQTWHHPGVRVGVLTLSELRAGDLPVFRRRWDRGTAEASLAAFARRWGVDPADPGFDGVRAFLAAMHEHGDPLSPDAPPGAADRVPDDAGRPRTRADVAAELLRGGRPPSGADAFDRAYMLAMDLFGGGFRPCGRPFIDHVVGTAGVLAACGFSVRVVIAGLLHAAYTHAPPHPGGPQETAGALSRRLGGAGTTVERLVRAAATRRPRIRALLASGDLEAEATTEDLASLAIAAADELEIRLSGEADATGRRDLMDDAEAGLAAWAAEAAGAPGLADALRRARAAAPTRTPRPLASASFRLRDGRPVPMATGLERLLEGARVVAG